MGLLIDLALQLHLSSRMDSEEPEGAIESRLELERFCRIVAGDDKLYLELLAAPDVERFASLTVGLGQKHEGRFRVVEVLSALEEKRRAWLQSWV